MCGFELFRQGEITYVHGGELVDIETAIKFHSRESDTDQTAGHDLITAARGGRRRAAGMRD
jgi:hypothetical protein